MKSVAIIGAGITGLTAAFRLQQQGVPVTVYEGSGQCGGVIRSLRRDGYLAEFGPNSILETSPKITSLIRDLGLESRRLHSRPEAEKRFLVRFRRPIAMPASPLMFFGSPLFSWGTKLALLREPFVRRSRPDVEESVAEFVLRRLGREFLDYAINPLVAGIYAGDPARLSVKHAFPRLLALEQNYGSLIRGQVFGARERQQRGEVSRKDAKKISFDEGLQVLTDALATRLGGLLRLNSSVRRVSQFTDGWRLTINSEGAESVIDHDAVLYTAPTHRLPDFQLLDSPGLDPHVLREIRYPPVASVVLGFRRQDVAHPLDGFGMLIPEVEGFRILGTLFSSTIFPGRAPAGHVILTSYVGGERAPELALRAADELVDLTCQDLQILLGVRGQPTFRHVMVYPKAIPQYELGYGRFKDLMNSLESRAPGLFFAGHFRDGIALGDSIVSAHQAAERLGQFWKAGSSAPANRPAAMQP